MPSAKEKSYKIKSVRVQICTGLTESMKHQALRLKAMKFLKSVVVMVIAILNFEKIFILDFLKLRF